MTALFAIITFFFIFVVVYLAISVVLAVAAWWMSRSAGRQNGTATDGKIELKIDRLKEKAFFIAIILTFFFVTPFVVLFIFILPD